MTKPSPDPTAVWEVPDLCARILAEGGCYSVAGGWPPVPHVAQVVFLRGDGQLRKGLGEHATDAGAALQAAYDDARKAMGK